METSKLTGHRFLGRTTNLVPLTDIQWRVKSKTFEYGRCDYWHQLLQLSGRTSMRPRASVSYETPRPALGTVVIKTRKAASTVSALDIRSTDS